MVYERMLNIAEKENISVKEADLRLYDGVIKGRKVAIRRNMTRREKACVLSEEIGHSKRSSGNILDYSKNAKQEADARLVGYDLLVGLEGIVKAYNAGCRNLYEMADYLEVTECFLKEAIDRYRGKYGLYASCGEYCVIFEPTLAVMRKIGG